MESKIAQVLKLEHHPVAALWTDEKPEGAAQFKPGKFGCVMFMFAAAAKGKTAAFDRKTYACYGGGVGLGFGNVYKQWPGGIECFYNFISSGNEESEHGRQVAERMATFIPRANFIDDFLKGERYKKTPELVQDLVYKLPIIDIPTKYVVFEPLEKVDPARGEPKIVTFLVDPDQLAALVVLANYDREGLENVAIPFAAGCQSIGVLAYREAEAEKPRCVVGLMDLSARNFTRRQLGGNLVTFSMPYKRFLEMETNVEGSFFGRETWKAIDVARSYSGAED